MIAALIGEGSSDRALLPALRWMLARLGAADIELEWIDTRLLRLPRRALSEKVAAARALSGAELLFIHRDADAPDPEPRYEEIRAAAGPSPHVAVVPIRETEAWLLIDAAAIAAAAGRPSVADSLKLPAHGRLEELADPKAALHQLLVEASGLTGRRAARFDPDAAVHRVADLVEDWSPLLKLAAFQRLERETRAALARP